MSHLLVAFTIEFDNEFESQMPHRTTSYGSMPPGSGSVPWLVSLAMWASCMRFIPADGIPAAELAHRAHLTPRAAQMVVKRMSAWWGYMVVEANPAERPSKPPASEWLLRPTRAGRQAQHIWEPLTGAIEDRWRARFGGREFDHLRAALEDIVSQLDPSLPDFLPIGEPRLEPGPTPYADDAGFGPTLPALLSKVLLAFALDFEAISDLSLGIYTSDGVSRLAISANILRVLDDRGVPVADLPALTGVAKMAIDNWLGSLEKYGYVGVGRDPGGSRFKIARLTPKGRQARDLYFDWTAGVELRWQVRFGTRPLSALRDAVEQLAVESRLWRGLEPYPDGWRAHVRRASTLPHYPVISPRGGFPDGS